MEFSPASITLIILAFTIISLVLEKIPMSITSLICCTALAVTGVLKPVEAFSQFSNTSIILFAAMFVIGYAFFETGAAKKTGAFITRFANKEWQLVLVLILVSGGMSMFLSNTGTTAIFVPLVVGLAASSGFSRSKLLYAMCVAVGMGGGVTLLGGPGWLYTKAQVELAVKGSTFGIFEPTKIGLPLFVISVIYMMIIGYKLTPDRVGDVTIKGYDEENKKEVPKWKGSVSSVILVLTVLAMVFEKNVGIPLWLTAVIGALALVITGVISEQEAYKAISWKTLFLFAGILPLSTALQKTGAGDIIAGVMLKAMGNTHNPYIITAVLMFIPCLLSQFISNATAAALMTPLGVSLALKIGADPTAVIMAISLGAGLAIATPIGQPGNTMIYGPSGLKFTDYVKVGGPLTLILYIVSVILIPVIWPFFKT